MKQKNLFSVNIPFSLKKPYTGVFLVILELVSGPNALVKWTSTFDSEYSANVSLMGLVKNRDSRWVWPKFIVLDQSFLSF